jgi:hypothetical protein
MTTIPLLSLIMVHLCSKSSSCITFFWSTLCVSCRKGTGCDDDHYSSFLGHFYSIQLVFNMHSVLLITLSVSSWKGTGCDDDHYSSLLGYGYSIRLVFVMHSFLLKHSSISSRKGTGCDDDYYSSLLDYCYSMQLVLVMHYFFLKHSLCIQLERYRMWWRPLLFSPWLWFFYAAIVVVMHYFFLKHSLCILAERYRMWWRPLLFSPWLRLFYAASPRYALLFSEALSVYPTGKAQDVMTTIPLLSLIMVHLCSKSSLCITFFWSTLCVSCRKGTGCDDDQYSSLLDYGSSMQLVLVMHYFFLKHSLFIQPERYRIWWRLFLFSSWWWFFYAASPRYALLFSEALSVYPAGKVHDFPAIIFHH